MSERDIEAVRRAYARFAAGELEAATAEADPAFELRPPDIYPEGPRTYRGVEGFAAWLEEIADAWGEWRYEPHRYIDTDTHVLVLVKITSEGRSSGVRLEREVAHVWSLKDGRVAACEVHLDVDAGFAAAGLPGRAHHPVAADHAAESEDLAAARGAWGDIPEPPVPLRPHALRWWHEDIVYHEDPQFPGSATFRGREAVIRRWEEYAEVLEMTGPPRIERIEARGGHFVLQVAFSTRASRSGIPTDHVWGYRQRMRDGQIVELRAFHDPAEAE